MRNMSRLTLLLWFLFANAAATTAAAQVNVPDELKPWQEWVLEGTEYRSCPFFFDRNVDQKNAFTCFWPGEMRLTVDASGAQFSQQWTVYADDQWIELPGSSNHWPDRVVANNRQVEVVLRDGVPGIRLAPGTWQVAGRFRWEQRPAILRVPATSAMISLTVDGNVVARPEVNRNGVFLGERQRDNRVRDAVKTTVYRLVADDIPTRLTTRLQINVSGSVREEVFGPILPEGFVPLSIRSQLPAKLEADGNLRLQIRPGRWVIELTARGSGVNDEVARPGQGTNLPDEEIWSYRSNDTLRVTAVESVPAVDPSQVEVPGEWQMLPAFRMAQDATFSVTERSRGTLAPSNDLYLGRTLWMLFDGGGFVVKDEINGSMRADWRLDMNTPFTLLSASEHDQSLLITSGADDALTGVELRHSDVAVEAIGRIEERGEVPVTGWDARFSGMSAVLNLPPGHKLLLARGVDEAAGSWVSQWQLLDFFLVLIISIAVWRLFGKSAAAIALAALVLSFHELNAPAWLWLNMLVGIALMRVVPAGRLKQLVFGYQALSALLLVIALIPFVAGQLRVAIYPQLEPQYSFHEMGGFGVMPESEPFGFDGEDMANAPEAKRSRAAMMMVPSEALDEIVVTGSKVRRDSFSRYAPNAIVQAGPGIPSWRWNSYRLKWSGPVDETQTMRLIIMPRWLVSALRIVTVGVLLLFAALLAADIFNRRWQLPGGLTLGRVPTSGVLASVMLGCALAASPDARAEIPDSDILQELEQRLLAPPDCVPRCAEVVSADVNVGTDTIAMTLSVHALENVAIPLPGSMRGWRPEAVLLDGAANARVIRAANGTFWLHVQKGQHSVALRGAIPAVDSLEILFPTPPRVISVDSDAWFVAGVQDRRLTSGSVQLTRLQSADSSDGVVRWESSRFPAFVRVERVVELDLDWRVTTTVHRVAPVQGALTLEIPLLADESIVSGDYQVNDNRVLVSMNPQQQSATWTSNLPLKSPLSLQAGDAAVRQEVWNFAIGSSWNAEFSGIAESNIDTDADGVRIAVFHPRGGESLTMSTSRPTAVQGTTIAFDAVSLNVTEGSRSRDVAMNLNYRSTRGSQHVIQLPVDAEVTRVLVDGVDQSMRGENGELTFGILPGSHIITVEWRESRNSGFRSLTPQIDIGAPASNINMTVTKSADRWLLATRGPKLGPAVLYWSELAVLILLALVLGRIGLTPLKTQHWLLLGLGFSTFSWSVFSFVAFWLLFCGARSKLTFDLNRWRYNALQVVLVLVTLAALFAVVVTLPAGLLGTPDMHVTGHRSYGNVLNWFADSSNSVLPIAATYSVPMWVYKAFILAWALWLSFAMLRWLPWVWQCLSRDGLWREKSKPGTEPDNAEVSS